MENNTVKTLLPLIKDKSYMQINEIVREWAKSRTNEETTDKLFKYAICRVVKTRYCCYTFLQIM